MNRFLLKSLLFLSPILAFFAAVECYLHFAPSAFIRRSNFAREHSREIEILIFGSSHQAINPRFLYRPAINLAYGSQDYTLEEKMLRRYLFQMPNLKLVVLELAYHSLEIGPNGPDYWRNSLYLRYHGINNFGRSPALADRLLFPSNYRFYWNNIKTGLTPGAYRPKLNRFGLDETDVPGKFSELNYDSVRIDQGDYFRNNRHQTISPKNFDYNSNLLREMIRLCTNRGVRVLLVSAPVYRTYQLGMIPEKLERRSQFLRGLAQEFPQVRFVNLENDGRFCLRDFYNDDHLNGAGAKKYSQFVNAAIESELE